MDSLSDVLSCCRGLDTDKAADRKKNAERLKQLLNRSSVITVLDKNTDARSSGKARSKLVTWNEVFKAVCLHVNIEVNLLQKAKEAQSSAAKSNREKKKQEISGIFKFCVKTAENRGPRLRSALVIKHITESLKDDFTCRTFGVDYSNILLKQILSVRKYWSEISSEVWHELMTIYYKLFLDQSCIIERALLARVIYGLVRGACVQCDIKPKKLISFFTEVFKNIRQEKTVAVVEHLVFALNVFIKTILSNSRVQVCSLGEKIFANLLYLWDNRPTEATKDEIVIFIQIQIQSHHPGGAKTEKEGAFAMDWDLWKSNLRKLYEVIYVDLQEMGGRHRFTTGKDFALKPEYVDLAANLCHQLFLETSHIIEVTQLSSSDTQGGSSAKKRRLESGWSSLQDKIRSCGNTPQVIPWLQLVSRIIVKFPQDYPEDEIVSMLTILSDLMRESKRIDVTGHVFRCAEHFAEISYSNSLKSNSQMKSLWKNIWNSTLRCVCLHHAEGEGFNLLEMIIKQQLIGTDKDIWNLFIPNITKPSQESIDYLSIVLRVCNIPDNYIPPLLGYDKSYSHNASPLRSLLIDWLFPTNKGTDNVQLKSVISLDYVTVAKVLVSLTLRDPSVMFTSKISVESCLTDVEKYFLRTGFDIPLLDSACDVSSPERYSKYICVERLLNEVQNVMKTEAEETMQLFDQEAMKVEDLSRFTCLISEVIFRLLQISVITPETVQNFEMIRVFKLHFRKFGNALVEAATKHGHNELLCVFTFLRGMFEFGAKCDAAFIMAEMCRSFTPTKLIEMATNLVFEKADVKSRMTKSLSNGSRQSLSTKQSRALDDFDDFDLEFEQSSHNNSQNSSALDDDMDDIDFGYSQDLEETDIHSAVCHSYTSPALLTDQQKLCMEVLRYLCSWCGWEKEDETSKLPVVSELKTRYVKNKLADLLNDKYFDPSKPFDLQMLEVLVVNFLAEGQVVSHTDVNNFIEAIKMVIRVHRKEQDVCCMCLKLIRMLIPFLSGDDDMVSPMIHECRDITLHLMSAFWTLQDKGDYTSDVRLHLSKCMDTFVKFDPHGAWSILKNSEVDEDIAIVQAFPQLLIDMNSSVRFYCASNIDSLFLSKTGMPLPKEEQDALFDRIYISLKELLHIQGNLSTERLMDEQMNRKSTVLRTISAILIASPVCRKKAIFALCQLIIESDLDIQGVLKALDCVSLSCGYKSSSDYLHRHIPYLLHQWFDVSYSIKHFPYQLFQVESITEFYRQHLKSIIPLLVMKKDLKTIQEISKELKLDYKDVLKSFIPQTMVHILPVFAASKNTAGCKDISVKKLLPPASHSYDMLTKELGKEQLESYIGSCLDDVVVNILMCLHKADYVDEILRCMPNPNPPFYSSETITTTFEFLMQSFTGSTKKNLISVLSKTPDSIQKMLLELATHLSQELQLTNTLRVLEMYKLLVDLLLQQFHTELSGNWAFVLREILFRMLHVMDEVNKMHCKDSSVMRCQSLIISNCLEILMNLCKIAIECCSEELGKYLPILCGSLMKKADLETKVGKKALKLLNFLIVDNASSLRQFISLLDPFPTTEAFKSVNETYSRIQNSHGNLALSQIISHFLSRSQRQHSVAIGHIQALRTLCNSIETCKTEFEEMVLECEDAQSESLLCKLLCELSHLGKSECPEVSQEIARCLGAIGPINLSSVAMPGKLQHTGLSECLAAFDGNYQMQKYCWIYHLLNEYLADSCIDVVKSTSDVLKGTLATTTGENFCAEYKENLGETEYLIQYLHPFRPKKKIQNSTQSKVSNVDEFITLIDDDNLWQPRSDHDPWIKNLVTQLILSGAVKDEILKLLVPICQLKVEFCETILPYLIHDILRNGQDYHKIILSKQISNCFTFKCYLERQETSSTSRDEKTREGCLNVESLRILLNVIQYLRKQQRLPQGRQVLTLWDNNFWLDLDYLQVAKAAQLCSAHFTALLYVEIWHDAQRIQHKGAGDGSSSKSSSQSQEFSQVGSIESLSSLSTSSGLNVQDMLLQSYRWIGEPDGVYGCGAGMLADPLSRIRTYQHENVWEKAVVTYDIELTSQSQTSHTGLIKALQNYGANRVLETYLKGMPIDSETSSELEEVHYEAAWRTGQWNLSAPTKLDHDCGFNKALYTALGGVSAAQSSVVEAALMQGRENVLNCLKESSLESSRSIYPVLSKLQCFSKIECFQNRISEDDVDLKSLLKVENSNDFEFIEPVKSTICALLQIANNRFGEEKCIQDLKLVQKDLAVLAREAGRYQGTTVQEGFLGLWPGANVPRPQSYKAYLDILTKISTQIAERIFHKLTSTATKDEILFQTRIEEAKLYWARAEQNTAKHILKVVIDNFEKNVGNQQEFSEVYAKSLITYGNWLAETKSESPNVIIEKYLEKTVELLDSSVDSELLLDAYMTLARFADAQYQNIVNYKKSSTYESKRALMKKAKSDVARLKAVSDSKDRYLRTLELQSKIDEAELEEMEDDRVRYLKKATENYICCLKCGDKYDLWVFRLISLWFDNADKEEINNMIENSLSRISSFKFLSLMYQLAARMSTKQAHGPGFQRTLNKIIESAAVDHPHHTLFIVLALANANKDTEFLIQGKTSKRRLSKSSSDSQNSEEDRVLAAKGMVERLKMTKIQNVILDMDKLCTAYIMLANWTVTQYKSETKPIPLPSSQLITHIKNLKNVAVPTCDIKELFFILHEGVTKMAEEKSAHGSTPVGRLLLVQLCTGFSHLFNASPHIEKSCDYKNMNYIIGFQPVFRLCGGVNLPKIIDCVGSDGIPRRQLVKGRDDLRQDAVMQQVFSMVNSLLKQNQETRKRRLNIRKYKVIPLSQRSGLLEWCEGTQPIGEYLVGNSSVKGAHSKYRPQDITALDCRKAMMQVASDASIKKKYKVFREICQKFQPVFRHFFMEKFQEPAVWYERRLAYTRSVATTSIVSYILGLGDRHVMNILVDCNSAELIHIDLGVAFEQGKILPTPETVPFRLTRDIVDGMGISGVEGVFRRCCEKTMEVMRNHQEALLTILQVLLYDPLYIWTISPMKAYALQQRRDRNEDTDANTTTGIDVDMSDSPGESSENVNKLAERVLLRLHQKLQGIEEGVQLSVAGQVNNLIQEASDPKNLCRLFSGWQPYI